MPTLKKRFNPVGEALEIRKNDPITPGMMVPVIVSGQPHQLVRMKWGLVPHWSPEPKVRFSNINARAETIDTSRAYAKPFFTRRCIIPATGFYEWGIGEDGKKTPYLFTLGTHEPFAFAGIWDRWRDAAGYPMDTCAIVTTRANPVVASIHERMPAILSQTHEDIWLDEHTGKDSLRTLLQPYPDTIVVKPVTFGRQDSSEALPLPF